jgi:hypothetical protein
MFVSSSKLRKLPCREGRKIAAVSSAAAAAQARRSRRSGAGGGFVSFVMRRF